MFLPIRETFRCRWVFASTRHRNFLRVAERDLRFVSEWEGRDARVYRLSDKRGFEGDWRVVGWYPDPARRLLDAPLLPEPSGPAAEGIEVSTRPAFVDLARLLAVPPLVRDVCGVAETDLLVDAATVVGIAVTTDDEFRVRLTIQSSWSGHRTENRRPVFPEVHRNPWKITWFLLNDLGQIETGGFESTTFL